jgi:hypothetical protein
MHRWGTLVFHRANHVSQRFIVGARQSLDRACFEQLRAVSERRSETIIFYQAAYRDDVVVALPLTIRLPNHFTHVCIETGAMRDLIELALVIEADLGTG